MKRRQQNKQKKEYTTKIASQNVWPWLGCCHCQCQPAWSLSLVPAALALGAASGGWSAWAPRCALLCGERPLKSCTPYNFTVPAATFCLWAITTKPEHPLPSHAPYSACSNILLASYNNKRWVSMAIRHTVQLYCTWSNISFASSAETMYTVQPYCVCRTFCLPFWQESINVHCKHTHSTTLLCLKHHSVWQH